jgi:hypothetical protein
MLCPMLNFPCQLEIPDAWLADAGVDAFPSASTPAYHSTAGAVLVSLDEIEPPRRVKTSQIHWRGLDRTRMVHLMKEIAEGIEIKPVELVELPELDDHLVSTPFRYKAYSYRVCDGVHRFYVSIAAGFKKVPATITTVPELVERARNLGWCT